MQQRCALRGGARRRRVFARCAALHCTALRVRWQSHSTPDNPEPPHLARTAAPTAAAWLAAAAAAAPRRRFLAAPPRAGAGGVADGGTLVAPGRSAEGARRKPPIYKVMLHNDNYNRREYVVKVLLKVVEGMTVDDAVVVMQEAHEAGVALVVACAQDVAEGYCEDLRLNGLISTLEPGH